MNRDERSLSRVCSELAASSCRGLDSGATESQALWDRIDARLQVESGRRRRRVAGKLVAGVAGALLLATAVFHRATGTTDEGSSLLLDAEQLAAVSQEQRQLERELDEWQELLLQGDPSRVDAPRLYGQLSFVDSNIEACQIASQHNRGNPEVRRSLLNAYRTKLHLLKELLGDPS